MYSPYLYGRQSELLALRAVKDEGGDLSALLPVVEPVLRNTAGLTRCVDAFGKARLPMVVVANPSRNEFRENPQAQAAFRQEVKHLFDKYSGILPGYAVNSSTTRSQIESFFKANPKREVALLYTSPSLNGAEFKTVAEAGQVTFHFVLNESATSSQIAAIPKKKLVDVRDHFNKLPRNADYTGVELFTDRHLVQKSIAAVGDYTVIGRNLEIGGGRPGAVAIHASYKHPDTGAIWVEHFVSDETDRDVGDVASKFLNAATKLVRAANRRQAQFGSNAAINGYKGYVASSSFPGLPKNKEHQIHHHIRVMLDNVK